MPKFTTKLKGSVVSAPIGALTGALVGYVLADRLGYSKNISVVSFAMVGLILGSALVVKMREK